MNHCRRCDCDFEKPGTCNCFAETAPRETPVQVPWVVPYPVYPTFPTYPSYSSPWWGIYPPYYDHGTARVGDWTTCETVSGTTIYYTPTAPAIGEPVSVMGHWGG